MSQTSQTTPTRVDSPSGRTGQTTIPRRHRSQSRDGWSLGAAPPKLAPEPSLGNTTEVDNHDRGSAQRRGAFRPSSPTDNVTQPAARPIPPAYGQPGCEHKRHRPFRKARRRQLRQILQTLTIDSDPPATPQQPPSPGTTDQPNIPQYCCTIAALNSQLPELAAVQCDCNDPL
jgi:hypothetical protein